MATQRQVYEYSVIRSLKDALVHAHNNQLRQAKRMMLTNDDYKNEHPNECKEWATHKKTTELEIRLKKREEKCALAVKRHRDRYIENRNARRS